ncbi:DUF4373 domain-containing protein [Bacteroides fragilis]|nr:DUF4373 domain-containing protein [Bacteroides fragilis]
MARPTKQGIEYFSLDVDFFSDIKVRRISKACGPASTSILICLLCNIYRDKGYYIEWDEDLPFVVADTIGTTEGAVEEVVKKAVQVGFFDKSLFDQYRILTSNGIQNRFKSAVSRREGFEYIPEYLVSVCNNPIQSNFCIQKPSSTEFLYAETQPNRVSACKSTQSKVKERISPPPHAREGDISGIRLFSDKSLTECYGELKANIPRMEQFCMNIRLDYPDFTPELFYGFLDRFFRKLQNEGEIVKSPKDAMSHFANWLNIELEKLKKMEVELVKTTLHAVLSPSQLQKPCVRKKELTPLQISLKTGSTASQLVDEWGGTIAQLNMGASLYDVAANGEIPTLADVGVVFGNSTSVQIITSHLESVLKYAGVELSREQMAETALAILSGYWFLNSAELCIFFTRLKNGNCGQFVWGKILNNQAVMVALSDFCKERREVIIRKETERMAGCGKRLFQNGGFCRRYCVGRTGYSCET